MVLVIAPDHAHGLDGCRVFYGPPSALFEQLGPVTVAQRFTGPTSVGFTMNGSPAGVTYTVPDDGLLPGDAPVGWRRPNAAQRIGDFGSGGRSIPVFAVSRLSVC